MYLYRLFGSRRESTTSTGPPATEPMGSIHNLQLDIMDDIVDDRRKARIKVFNTSSERICEVHTVDEAGNSSTTPMRYNNRRYSDFTCSTLTPIPARDRRASENPVISTAPTSASTSASTAASSTRAFLKKTGIVVTNTDLMSIITSLASSATDINKCVDTQPERMKPTTSSGYTNHHLAPDSDADNGPSTSRKNSFDVTIMQNVQQMVTGCSSSADKGSPSISSWFDKHTSQTPLARKKSLRSTASATVSFSRDVIDRLKDKEESRPRQKPKARLRWDRAAFVDATILGTAIENFLSRAKARATNNNNNNTSPRRKSNASTSQSSSSFWFDKDEEDDSNDSCDQSLCGTIKDLFVK